MLTFNLKHRVAAVAPFAIFFGCWEVAWADDIQLIYPDNNVSSKPILEFRARPPTGIPPSAGHTFVFLGRELDNGTTIFYGAGGFYPENNTIKNLLLGPGSVKYTIDDMKTDQVFRVRISEDQEEQVKYVLTNWETKTYGVAWQNCVSLERDVARSIGLEVPEFDARKVGGEIPSNFVAALRHSNNPDKPLKYEASEAKRMEGVQHKREEELRNVQSLLEGRARDSQQRAERARQSSPGSALGGGGPTQRSGPQQGGQSSGSGSQSGPTMQFDYTVPKRN